MIERAPTLLARRTLGPALSHRGDSGAFLARARGSLHLPPPAAATAAGGCTGRSGSAPSPRFAAPLPPGLARVPPILRARSLPGPPFSASARRRGAVPGVAGSERVARSRAAVWMEEGKALAPPGGARQFPPSAPGAGDVPPQGTLGGWPRPDVSPPPPGSPPLESFLDTVQTPRQRI